MGFEAWGCTNAFDAVDMYTSSAVPIRLVKETAPHAIFGKLTALVPEPYGSLCAPFTVRKPWISQLGPIRKSVPILDRCG